MADNYRIPYTYELNKDGGVFLVQCYGPVLDRNGRQLTPMVNIALDALRTLTGAQA